MKEVELCKNIQENLNSKDINLSNEDLCNLYVSTLAAISEQLDDGKQIDVTDFGIFWKKGEGKASITLFKAAEGFIDQIKTKQ